MHHFGNINYKYYIKSNLNMLFVEVNLCKYISIEIYIYNIYIIYTSQTTLMYLLHVLLLYGS